MTKEERDYAEPPVKVDLDKDEDAIQAEGQSTEDEQVVDDEEVVATTDEDDRPEDERTRIAREYDERQGNVTAASEEESEEESDEPKQVEVTVNGQTRMVDAAKVEEAGGVAAYQKNLAADQKFRELAEQQRAFNEQVQRFNAAQAAAVKAPPAEEGKPAPSEDGQERLEQARAIFGGLYDGEEDKAAQNLVDFIDTRQGPEPIDPDAVTEKAVQGFVALQYQRDIAEGKADFAEDYPEIEADPELKHAADQLTNVIADEHPLWRPQRVISEAGKRVRKEIKARNKAAGGTAADKLAAKRASTNVGANTGRGKPKPSPEPQSDSDYVVELQKKRGLVG